MKHLYFVRHGESVMNKEGFFSGVTDTPLTETGQEQARQAGLSLQDTKIDCIVASPITRAYDTAVIIAKEIGYDPAKIITCDDLVERDFGPMEGEVYTTKINLDAIDGVEHSSELVERVAKGLKFIEGLEAETVLVVSHGAVGRALRVLLQDDVRYHQTERFKNAQVAKLL